MSTAESRPVSDALAVVVMGVSGAGKTTVGRALAQALGGDFIDGDDLHTDAARAKMGAGEPLNDSDVEEAVASGRIVPGTSASAIFNREGLEQALAEVSQDLPWIERLEVVAAEPIAAGDVNDDLKLELAL